MCCRLLSLFLVLFSVVAPGTAAPSWYRHPVSELRLQSSHVVPEGGVYSQPQDKVIISPALTQAKPSSLELSFGKGAHITSTVFEVGAGGRLVFRNCLLNQVCLVCQPGGEIRMENCAMMQVYFSEKTGYDGISSPAPRVVIIDSTISHGTIESPAAMGLKATNSKVILSDLYATERDGANSVSSFSGCIFAENKIFSPEFIVCTSKCAFTQCDLASDFPQDFASFLAKPVLVKVAWWNGTHPITLPEKAGMVFFERYEFTPALQAAGTREGGPQVTGAVPAGQHLSALMTMVDANGLPAPTLARTGLPTNGELRPARPAEPAIVVAAGLAFKSRISSVNGLLIQQLSSGEEAGMVTKMNLTALPSLGGAPSTLKFNQSVGDDMEKALKEVSKFTQLRHGGMPGGHALEIGFEDKYIPKDGPSAAVACALLLEAAITGKKWDPAFAVTGDMNADGSVQPIGGVQAKIRGATKGECKLVGVPVKNEKAVQDILVLEGPAPLVGITVFGIKTFDDALLLASPERPQALQNALTDFDSMRTVMLRDPRQIVPLLRTQHAAQRLQALLTAAPNCYSAKYLLQYVQGRSTRTLSIGGSIEAAQSSAEAIVSAIDHDVDTNISSLKGDELGTSLNKLRALRPVLDQRVWPYVDNLMTYGDVIRSALLNPVRSGARYTDLVVKANKAASGAKAAYDKLINDVQVREELGL